jgi:hypothetical protein
MSATCPKCNNPLSMRADGNDELTCGICCLAETEFTVANAVRVLRNSERGSVSLPWGPDKTVVFEADDSVSPSLGAVMVMDESANRGEPIE